MEISNLLVFVNFDQYFAFFTNILGFFNMILENTFNHLTMILESVLA